MQTRVLGRTGVHVSEYCLGAMMFGPWGNADHDDCVRMTHRAFEAGINFIDTADVYSAGESERIVAKAIADRRDRVVLATKFMGPMGDDPNMRGGSRRWILQECENSLRRLGTDYIDLYQIHRPEELADIDETLGALSDLVHQGKIRYLGHSTFPAEYIVEAQWTSERRNRVQVQRDRLNREMDMARDQAIKELWEQTRDSGDAGFLVGRPSAAERGRSSPPGG